MAKPKISDASVNEPECTPENTPVPGGGSWRWDASASSWVENVGSAAEDPVADPAPAPVAQPVEQAAAVVTTFQNNQE